MFANTRFYVYSNHSIARMYSRHYSYVQLNDYYDLADIQRDESSSPYGLILSLTQDGRDLSMDRAPG